MVEGQFGSDYGMAVHCKDMRKITFGFIREGTDRRETMARMRVS